MRVTEAQARAYGAKLPARKRGKGLPQTDGSAFWPWALRMAGLLDEAAWRDRRETVLYVGGYCYIWRPEYQFAALRKWRFDWAEVARLVAIEVDGGQYKKGGGRHGGDDDREKLNQAAAMGWRLIRFSAAQLRRDPAGCVDVVRRAVEWKP
mgnify:CR=1 FL=1